LVLCWLFHEIHQFIEVFWRKKNQNKRFFDSEKLQNTKPKGFLILKIFKKPGNQRLFNFQTNDHPTLVFYPSAGRKASQYPSVCVVLSNPNVLVVHK